MCRTIGAPEPQGANSSVGKLLLVKRHDLLKKENSAGGFGKELLAGYNQNCYSMFP